ncbi:MAG TPA: GAF domain-containing protein [Bryobacteraceae bacterium]|nr:GAF domain-containing protein [Bryobacteraceae bacterium]
MHARTASPVGSSASAPIDRNFHDFAHGVTGLMLQPVGWMPAVAAVFGILLIIGIVLVDRQRRTHRDRARLRKIYGLGEEILSAPSAELILKYLAETLPEVLRVSRVLIYLHNRSTKTLEAVAAEGEPPVSLPLVLPPNESPAGAVACFQFRRALAVPDSGQSPLQTRNTVEGRPRSVLFVPLLAQGDALGVLSLECQRSRTFSDDDRELAQHLAKQAAAAIRLLEQRTVQERLFRTEKMAAVGRLISGVVNELRAPLSSAASLASRAAEQARSAAEERELGAIAAESRKAMEIVDRLVSYAEAEQSEARPVAIGALLRNLIEFREADWKASGIRVLDYTTREPLHVLGSQGQLEQVLLNLLVHAEQSLSESGQKLITVRTSVLGKRLLIEITFTGPPVSNKPGDAASVLGVARSVIAGHGGEVRLIEKNNSDPRFEIELPITGGQRGAAAAAPPAAAGKPASAVPLTALVIEPDEATLNHLVGQLSARGARAVPVENADKGLELTQRMRFDLAFCSVHAPGLNWVELSERMQPRVGAFVLISDRYDPELAADFETGNRFVVARPVREAELERIWNVVKPSAVPLVKERVG